jgi:membrane associated rhomboid family serine protease
MQNILILSILLPTVIISIMAFQNPELFDKLKFNPSHISNSKEWYRFFSYGIIHADFLHLIVNMYVLWSFGRLIIYDFRAIFENLGNLYFLLLYIPALGVSVIPSYFKNKADYSYNAVGASGAISAVVYVSIILNPTMSMGLIFIPIPMPAWVFGALYLAYTIIMSKKENTRIGHSAHLWGAVYGMVYLLLVEPRLYLWFFNQVF